MSISRCTSLLFAVSLAFTPLLRADTVDKPIVPYSATLISPHPGEVLVPGQHVKILWSGHYPKMDLSWCETEIYLSLDGGRTFSQVTGERDARTQSVDWIVPNTPSDTAVLNIRFGCLGRYPETNSWNLKAAFVISGEK
ncbi:MAG: hypothetical protein ABI992_03165 [Chthoniobacterales bacterium]